MPALLPRRCLSLPLPAYVDVQGELGMTPIPQISGQRLMKAFFTKQPREQVEYSHGQITPTVTPGSAPKGLKELDEEHRVRQAGLLERWQLGRIKSKARGYPSYDSKYVEGLHKTACNWLVSRRQCPEPSVARIWSEGVGLWPTRHRAQGFKVADVAIYFQGLPEEDEIQLANEVHPTKLQLPTNLQLPAKLQLPPKLLPMRRPLLL